MELTPTEKSAIGAFRSGDRDKPRPAPDHALNEWLDFALNTTLEACRVIRRLRMTPLQDSTSFKQDATPVTAQEEQIEQMIRERLTEFCPDAELVGEEMGGFLPEQGIAVAVDPLDGTWALINRMSTTAVVLAFFRNGSPFLGIIANPATGEISYTMGTRKSRLLHLDMFGEQDIGVDLPLDQTPTDQPLVLVHSSRGSGPLVASLIDAWTLDQVRLVRMESGSPSLALADAAKGNFIYVNLWERRPADPFDFVAAVQVIRNAGGEVVDGTGRPIDAQHHSGLLIAGINHALIAQVAEIANHCVSG
ncbi:MAG: fructose-1,6-bisphosphatase/inositol monophosphatase family enzyme [Phycisphaerales bacterium]|jgi:fructose-1,6-bisphosphatase/inositol monophosphatase family enzyme